MGNAPPSYLTQEEIADLRYHTNFNRDELQAWYTEFLKEFPEGRLNKEEFCQLYSKVFPQGNQTKFVDNVFRTFDTDKNGTIDFREFVCGISVLSRGSHYQKLAWVFSLYDIDNDGYITKEEMLNIITAKCKLVVEVDQQLPSEFKNLTPEMITEQIFQKVDEDGDGKLTLSEFLEGVTNNPAIVSLLH
ncbi:neurocalcin homolog [Diadema setosum]|uniref:neurocalcin homolog n=1 Tax=Diadema setosum TaxID=31175 RepID=UPI003B3AD8AE